MFSYTSEEFYGVAIDSRGQVERAALRHTHSAPRDNVCGICLHGCFICNIFLHFIVKIREWLVVPQFSYQGLLPKLLVQFQIAEHFLLPSVYHIHLFFHQRLSTNLKTWSVLFCFGHNWST